MIRLTADDLAEMEAKADIYPYIGVEEHVARLREAYAEIDRLNGIVTEWEPIETAPKDSSQMILAFVPPNIYGLAIFEKDTWCWPEEDESKEAVGVTHWMPLPNLPNDA